MTRFESQILAVIASASDPYCDPRKWSTRHITAAISRLRFDGYVVLDLNTNQWEVTTLGREALQAHHGIYPEDKS